MTPAHDHNCDRCVYLATRDLVDLYVCPGGALGETWIARYSSAPADYASSPRRLIVTAPALRADRHWIAIAAILGVDMEAEGRAARYREMRSPGNLAEWTAAEAFAVAYRGAIVTGRGIVYPDGRDIRPL